MTAQSNGHQDPAGSVGLDLTEDQLRLLEWLTDEKSRAPEPDADRLYEEFKRLSPQQRQAFIELLNRGGA